LRREGILPLKKILLNLIFYPSFVLVTVLIPAITLFPMVLFRLTLGTRKTLYILRALIRCYGFIVVRILPFPFVRVEYEDFERDKNRGACVFVCNHRSSSDAFLMESLNREVVQVVNNWPFKIPVIGMIGRLAGYLSVRTMPFEEFQRTSCKLLREGVSVVAFPEGSRSRDKTLHQFNGAVFRVAQAAGVPIIPICLSGNQDIPPKGSGVLNPGTIKIHKLPALEWESFKDLTPFVVKNKVRAVIQEELERLEA
jgi:1-acyl-sn-glycerol-3-phosphate acyltransferase